MVQINLFSARRLNHTCRSINICCQPCATKQFHCGLCTFRLPNVDGFLWHDHIYFEQDTSFYLFEKGIWVLIRLCWKRTNTTYRDDAGKSAVNWDLADWSCMHYMEILRILKIFLVRLKLYWSAHRPRHSRRFPKTLIIPKFETTTSWHVMAINSHCLGSSHVLSCFSMFFYDFALRSQQLSTDWQNWPNFIWCLQSIPPLIAEARLSHWSILSVPWDSAWQHPSCGSQFSPYLFCTCVYI